MENTINGNSLFQYNDVLIIGNGFDLDLGLKTSYCDFYRSEQWPFKNPDTLMGAFLNSQKSINNWMDLEEKIGEYAVRSYYNNLNYLKRDGIILKTKDKSDYKKTINSLANYLLLAEKENINIHSTAARILECLLNSPLPPTIITFNYTNIEKIARRLKIGTDFIHYYIHGNLDNNNIVLGVGENYTYNNYKLPIENDFMYKTSSSNYNPPLIADILNKANHITFFGLSIGGMDAPYFRGLFQNLSSQYGKSVTIFTYDDISKLQILRHLRNVESINLNDIWTRHSIEFIRTKDHIDENKVINYCNLQDNWELDENY